MHFTCRWILVVLAIAISICSAAKGGLDDNTGQVTIDGVDDDPQGHLPISATIFDGVPGPKNCRGRVLARLRVPPPALESSSNASSLTDSNPVRTQKACYDFGSHASVASSGPIVAGCANFVAKKSAGCQARLYAEPGCQSFLNLAVFIPEDRAVGGFFRSVAVECGVPEPDPETLGVPPLSDLLKKQGGTLTQSKRRRVRGWEGK